MRRIRWALLAVALGLGIPVALLAWRALEGLAVERAVRHQALAERAFDEMERALSEWLSEEEARPFDHYRFYVTPGERSPLSLPADAEHDFVIGAFQVDPDGSFHTPLQPRDAAEARALGHWPLEPQQQEAIARVMGVARETWGGEATRAAQLEALEKREVAPAPGRRDAKKAVQQDPGTTRPLGGPLADEMKEIERRRKDLDAPREEETVDIFSALEGLNLGADQRAERKQKTALARVQGSYESGASYDAAPSLAPPPSPSSSGTATAPQGASAGELFRDEADDAVLAEEAPGDLPELQLQNLRSLGYVVSEPGAVAPSRQLAAPRAAPTQAANRGSEAAMRADDAVADVRLTLDPMVGRPVGDPVLLLYRTVVVGTRGYRQGLVLDRARLARWLEARALGPSGLSQVATLDFGSRELPEADPDTFVFQHRFAEPFDALSARLALTALPGIGGSGTIYALVALLALVGAVGLFAVDRMVAVTVHFAERRNNFVSAVTHELKTPLTAIRMYAEMLRDGLVPSERKKSEYYGTITDESERLSRLIDNVLEFSRLERGTREMSFRVGSLEPVVREAAERLQAHAAQQGFTLEVELAPDLPPVRYDRDALLQVLFNLVDNAMKYARGSDARRVVIEGKRAGGGVQLAVRDFGPGVAGLHLSRIFEPFYRGEDELTRNTQGTGIGLALVRDLAQRMGARVRGDNAPGGGFRVSLAFDPAG